MIVRFGILLILILEIKCCIPGTRPTYSPVNFTWEHVDHIIVLHFSNSLVNMFAKSMMNMLSHWASHW